MSDIIIAAQRQQIPIACLEKTRQPQRQMPIERAKE
jgi:hypothetical protein